MHETKNALSSKFLWGCEEVTPAVAVRGAVAWLVQRGGWSLTYHTEVGADQPLF